MSKFDPDALASTMSIREFAEIQFITGVLPSGSLNDHIPNIKPDDADFMVRQAIWLADIWIKNKQKGENHVK